MGTLIAGVFFGLPHLLGAVNPFTGRFILGYVLLGVTASACFMSVVLGVVRRRRAASFCPQLFTGC